LAVVVCRNQVFGIHVNEAAIHDEELTLLSEYQMAQYGIVVDPRARHHPVDHNGGFGRQMISPSEGVIIPLTIRSALMTMMIRKPTPEELETMDFHTLTSDEEWLPKYHQDEEHSIDSFHSVAFLYHCSWNTSG